MSFLSSLFIALLQPIFGWFAKRKADKEYAEEQAMRDKAFTDGNTIRDNATKQEEASHVQTQADLDHLAADAGKSERVQSDDVNAAIYTTNRDVR